MCTPVATTVDASAPTWTSEVVLCSPSTGQTTVACSTVGQVCLPHAQSPFDSDTYCIARPGSFPCPSGFLSTPSVYDDGTGYDTRACSACTCGPPSGATCPTTATSYASSTCGGTGVSSPLPLSCTQVTGSSIMVNLAPPGGGSCTPNGGVPMGAFTPNLTTVCCVVATGT
jgi:hypothetical protein